MMSGMPLKTRLAFNKLWNNKFYYKVASCWLFLLIHYLQTLPIYKRCPPHPPLFLYFFIIYLFYFLIYLFLFMMIVL